MLDEAHTYTGAKGTEVAHLVRRLKERLGIEPGSRAFRGIATSDDRTMPAVWMLTNAFAEQIQIHCDDGLIGYTSHTPVSVGQQVAFIKSAPVAIGNELVIPDGSGLFDIRSGPRAVPSHLCAERDLQR